MAGWKCFMIAPSPFCRRSFRRYSSEKCSIKSIHDVSVVIDEAIECVEESAALKGEFSGDSRWPSQCPCGYSFQATDHWQVHAYRLYDGAPDGKLYTLQDQDLPIGAMWHADWLMEAGTGPDGLCLVLRLPGGADWPMDVTTSDHSWSRMGIPPVITAGPSINHVGVYHGALMGGIISEDVEGRTFLGVPRTA